MERGSARPGHHAHNDGGQTARLLGKSTRAGLLGMLCLVALMIGVFVRIDVGAAQRRLLDTGMRTTGTVSEVWHARKSSRTVIDVQYLANGRYRIAPINVDSSRNYREGDEVTVLYDSSDVTSIRTVEEENLPYWLTDVMVAGDLAAVAGLIWSGCVMTRWRRRYRAVRATGWHEGKAEIHKGGRWAADKESRITVEFPDGRRLKTDIVRSMCSFGLADASGVPVRVGGAERAMVVLLLPDRWRARPLAVPVRAAHPWKWSRQAPRAAARRPQSKRERKR